MYKTSSMLLSPWIYFGVDISTRYTRAYPGDLQAGIQSLKYLNISIVGAEHLHRIVFTIDTLAYEVCTL